MVSEHSTAYQMASLFLVLLSVGWTVWIYASMFLRITRILRGPDKRFPIVNLIWYWTRPVAQAYLFAYWPFQIFLDAVDWWDALFFAIALWCWKDYKDSGDDDDHKKIKKKLKESVKVLNGRLVVTSA